jgi:hypothetical protein
VSSAKPRTSPLAAAELVFWKKSAGQIGVAQVNDSLTQRHGPYPLVTAIETAGFCKLIADRREHTILGAHVPGEYSAETVPTVAASMAAGMTVEQVAEQVAELQLAFPTFTEGVSMAAQKICRSLGAGRFRQVWSYLGPED